MWYIFFWFFLYFWFYNVDKLSYTFLADILIFIEYFFTIPFALKIKLFNNKFYF